MPKPPAQARTDSSVGIPDELRDRAPDGLGDEASYRYSGLPTALESIRLLRLLPSKDENAPIQCQLFNCSLQESGKRTHPYDALSYVWGESHKPWPIIRVDKHVLPVTPNLLEALLHLRHDCIERIL
jgi:integrase